MNGFWKIIGFCFGLLIGFTACESATNKSTNQTEENTSTTPPNPTEKPTKKTISPVAVDCEIIGKILEGNRKLVKDQHALVCIVADDSTKDEKLGDSHRILEVYNTQSCNLIQKETLPINVKPDFPYQIADIIYNNASSIVAIKGFGSVYCYDVQNKKLLEALIPDFLTQRMAADAQSRRILHLEVWENFMIGYAMDAGTFVFDLTDLKNVKALLPAAEYDLSSGEGKDFSSLFFLKSENGDTYQAILPNYEDDKFNVNPIFDTPKNINPTIAKNVQNDQFIIVKNKNGESYAVDMETQKNVALPNDLKSKSTQEILSWLKK